MSVFSQLILDSFALPESKKGGYRAWREDLGVEVTMISGRLVKEIRGTVWRISYQYGYFNNEDRARVIAACEKGRKTPIICAFLPPDSDTMISCKFFVTAFNDPKFMWSRAEGEETVPVWGDFSVELREVKPSD